MTTLAVRSWVWVCGLALVAATVAACGTPRSRSGFQTAPVVKSDSGTTVPGSGPDGGSTPADTGSTSLLEMDASIGADVGACGSGYDQQGCSCTSLGQSQKCYVGEASQAGVGTCTWGTQTCTADGEFGVWGACTGSGAPTPPACDGVDHACNGASNQGCACMPNTTQSCYSGPSGTEGVGICKGGTQTCMTTSTGSTWGPCTGQVTPAPTEVCSSTTDDTCDGKVGCADPTCNCTCTPGATQSCYSGPSGTEGVGSCKAGTQTCVANASGATWSACVGQVLPAPMENCSNNSDANCNGQAGCADSMCTTNPACEGGNTTRTMFCNTGGSVNVNNISYDGDCPEAEGFPQPGAEICSAVDNDGQCDPTFGSGGSFNANCAGNYNVCARLVSGAGCTITQTCVMVSVPTDGATVPLPAFPGFTVEPYGTNACLDDTCPSGSISTSLDVTGMTTDGIAVSRPDVAVNIDPVVWCTPDDAECGNNGGGGGGF